MARGTSSPQHALPARLSSTAPWLARRLQMKIADHDTTPGDAVAGLSPICGGPDQVSAAAVVWQETGEVTVETYGPQAVRRDAEQERQLDDPAGSSRGPSD